MPRPFAPPRPVGSLLNNLVFRGVAYQVLLGLGIGLVALFLYVNVSRNLQHQGIATGFSFLTEAAGFEIGESVIAFDSAHSYGRALWVGVLNTLRVSLVGIVLATVVGVTMGVARVSPNWIVARLASAYVEVGRNVPVVLHVIFWATVIRNLPSPRQALSPLAGVFLMNRGLAFPVPVAHGSHPWIAAALLAGLLGAAVLAFLAHRRHMRTGIVHSTVRPGLALIGVPPLAVWLAAGAPLAWDVPALHGFNFQGGRSLTPEFAALLVGITVYTGAFIAEIVRAGIQSVPAGQGEAARALGLREGLVMRRVIFPQALRVIVPPTASQYLSLTKNSSLGVLIGYPDLVNVGNTTLNQTGQAVEAIAVMMTVYLSISLVISLGMNAYNRLVAIKER